MSEGYEDTSRRSVTDEGYTGLDEDPSYTEASGLGGTRADDPVTGDPVTGGTWEGDATYASAGTYGDTESSSTTGAVKEQGKQLGQDAVDSGKQVAGVAADQAKSVASEAGTQAKNLLGEAKTQLSRQVSTQQDNLTSWLRSMGDELRSMVDKDFSGSQFAGSEGQSGTVTDLVQQASDRVHGVASWLENHEPADVLDEVSRFARQRPGVFLALAAVGGLLAGRLTRGLTAGSSNQGQGSRSGFTGQDTGSVYSAPGPVTSTSLGTGAGSASYADEWDQNAGLRSAPALDDVANREELGSTYGQDTGGSGQELR